MSYKKEKRSYLGVALLVSALLMVFYVGSIQIGNYLRSSLESQKKTEQYLKLYSALTGKEKSQKTLLILANNAEIRTGGGFIGTVGIIEGDRGKLDVQPLVGVYAIDSSKNCDIDRYEQAEYLKVLSPCPSLRDSSNDIDFPSNAKKALYFYHLNTNLSVDNVVQISPELLEKLLEKLGPVYLKDYDLNISKDNFRETVQLEVEAGKDKQAKKDPKSGVLGSLANQLINKLINEKANNLKDYLDLINEMIEEKHLVIYSEDQDTQKLIEEIGASGEIKNFDENYFMLTDANFSAKKNSPFVKNEVSITQAIQQDGKSNVNVVINTKHTSDFKVPYVDPNSNQSTWLVGKDDGFVSVVLPRNVTVKSTEGAASSYKMSSTENKSIISYIRTIEPLNESVAGFNYEVPTRYVFGDRLVVNTFVQKQINGWPYKINYSLTLPPKSGYRLVATNLKAVKEVVGTENTVVYTGEVNSDQILSFIYEKTK